MDDKHWVFTRIEAYVPGQGVVAHEVDYCPLALFNMGICSLEGECKLGLTDLEPPAVCPIYPRFAKTGGRLPLTISLVKRKRWDREDKVLTSGEIFKKFKKLPRGMYEAKMSLLLRLTTQELRILELEAQLAEKTK